MTRSPGCMSVVFTEGQISEVEVSLCLYEYDVTFVPPSMACPLPDRKMRCWSTVWVSFTISQRIYAAN